jgi:SAM-dependent methyltransferase
MTPVTQSALSPAVETAGRMAFGMVYSRMLYAAAALDLADHLRQCDRSIEELARLTETHAPSLERLLRVLAGYGVFRFMDDGRYALNDVGATLCRDAPVSVRDLVLHLGSEAHVRMWSGILFSLRTGAPAFEHVNGCSLFEYLDANPQDATLFNRVMSMGTSRAIPDILENNDFSGCSRIVDVGGGNGSLLAAILKSATRATGALLECAAGIRDARANPEIAALGDRVDLIEGDFFTSAPEGADVYLLKHVLHDWNDERARAILRTVRRAMAPASRLLIVEVMYEKGDGSTRGKLLDLSMLLMTGGRERREQEYRDLCRAAGLTVARVVPAIGRYCLMEAACA